MTLKDTVVQNLFDASGRSIPGPRVVAAVNAASSRYGLPQPRVDYAETHARIAEHVGSAPLTAADFAERAEALLDGLRRNEDTAQLIQGVRVPFMLAQQVADDIGRGLDETYLPALARSWKARFPKYDFKNELRLRLTGAIGIAEGSRYEHLIAAMAEGPVVGFYFPLAFSGFSPNAARQQLLDLPDAFMLSGGWDATVALVGCPDLFVKEDGYAPQLDLAALRGPVPGYGYHFAPYGHNLTFNGRHHNGLASDYCSPGLTVIAASKRKI